MTCHSLPRYIYTNVPPRPPYVLAFAGAGLDSCGCHQILWVIVGHDVWHISREAWVTSRSQHCSAVSGPGGRREKAGYSQDGDHPSQCVMRVHGQSPRYALRTMPCGSGSGSGRKGGRRRRERRRWRHGGRTGAWSYIVRRTMENRNNGSDAGCVSFCLQVAFLYKSYVTLRTHSSSFSH